MCGIKQPRSAKELVVPGGEYLEKEDINRYIALVKITQDTFCAIVEGRCDDDYLMALIKRFLFERLPKTLLKILR